MDEMFSSDDVSEAESASLIDFCRAHITAIPQLRASRLSPEKRRESGYPVLDSSKFFVKAKWLVETSVA